MKFFYKVWKIDLELFNMPCYNFECYMYTCMTYITDYVVQFEENISTMLSSLLSSLYLFTELHRGKMKGRALTFLFSGSIKNSCWLHNNQYSIRWVCDVCESSLNTLCDYYTIINQSFPPQHYIYSLYYTSSSFRIT